MHSLLSKTGKFLMEFELTPEQSAIVAAAKDSQTSIMVQALAGCSKTTTLVEITRALPPGTIGLALAFNTKIKKELEERFPPNFTVKTLNGLGHAAWGSALGKYLKVEDRKIGQLVTKVAKERGIELGDDWDEVRTLVSAAMQIGIVPEKFGRKGLVPDSDENWKNAFPGAIEPTDNMVDLARAVLIRSIELGFEGTISYDDQIYLPTMFEGQWPRYPLVLVDEAQDLSPLNHLQIKKVAADRIIVVGDSRQAVYAFRGADSNSMTNLRALRKEWIDLTLSTTFRCPKVVVQRQLSHAPLFKAFDANAEGKFHDLRAQKQIEENEPYTGWNWKQIPEGEVFILCRNNAPLLSMAFKLIRQGVGVVMLGRDIGKNLVALSKKLCPKGETPVTECRTRILAWMESESDTARANGKEERLAAITDRGECLLAVCEAEGVHNAKDLRERLEALFNRERGNVTLATGHRAKGLERDIVVHLDPFRIPSKHARRALSAGNPGPMQQELNLRYVIETRAKRELVLANLEDFV